MKRLPFIKPNTTNAGFTLIEVLVVLIIAGVLAAIASPSWVRYQANRQVQAVEAELKQVLEQAQTTARTKRVDQQVTLWDASVPTVQAPNLSGDGTRIIELGNQDGNQDGNQTIRDDVIEFDVVDLNGPLQLQPLTTDPNATPPFRISFDFQGAVNEQDLNGAVLPIVINIENQNDLARPRCVVVATLLGTLKSGSGDTCNPALY